MSALKKVQQAFSKGAAAALPLLPTGTVSIDPDGVKRYTLSDEDVRKLRGVLKGVLTEPTGRPAFRLSRVDEAIVPAVLSRFGLPVGLALAGVFVLGRLSAGGQR